MAPTGRRAQLPGRGRPCRSRGGGATVCGMRASVRSQPEGDDRRILIYDGECRFCVAAKQGLEQLGATEAVRFVPYQSPEAAQCLGAWYQPGRPEVAFLVDPRDGNVQQGLDAFLPLLPGLPGGQLLARLARLSVLRPVALLAYRLVARFRYRWFGRVA